MKSLLEEGSTCLCGAHRQVGVDMPPHHSDKMNSTVTIVIATADRPGMVLDCVKSFKEQTPPEVELLVVEAGKDAPVDEQRLKDLWPNTRVVKSAVRNAGQVSNVTSVAGTSSYTLDAADRLSTLTVSPLALTFTNSYNPYNGLLSGMSCPNTGVSVSYGFDVMDRVTGITWKDASNNVLRSFSYGFNVAGMITNVAMEDGSSVRYQYDSLDRLVGETKLNSSGETVYEAGYSFDKVGNRTEKTVNGFTVSYSAATNGNRLSSWTVTPPVSGAAAPVNVFGYSTETIGTNSWFGQLYVSNIVAQTPEVSGTNFWLYNLPVGSGSQYVIAAIGDAAGNVDYATNTITVKAASSASYGHNTAGCITNITYTGANYTGTTDIAWNQQYQIASISTNGTVAESFEYDALGRRVYTASGGETNFYVWDGAHVVAEVNSAGQLQKSFIWGPGIDNLLAFTDYTGGSTSTYYCITDHQNTIHAVTDSSGNIVESYRFDAWGRVLGVYDSNGQPLSESAIGNHYLHQGRWYSWKTGLYYHRARWRDPVAGRWLSKDPIGISGGLNQYEFCRSNPVNFIDPDGLATYLITTSRSSNFQPTANATANTIKAQDWFVEGVDQVVVQPVATIPELSSALSKYPDKMKWIHISHGDENNFEVGTPAGSYFIGKGDLGALPTGGFLRHATIGIAGCWSGAGNDSIAQAVANSFGRTTWGAGSKIKAVNWADVPKIMWYDRLWEFLGSPLMRGRGWRKHKPKCQE